MPIILKECFEVNSNHIRLLERSQWSIVQSSYCSHLSQDPKKPFGNSDIEGDVCAYMDTMDVDCVMEDMVVVLAIVTDNLMTGIRIGEYERVGYGRWTYVGE